MDEKEARLVFHTNDAPNIEYYRDVGYLEGLEAGRKEKEEAIRQANKAIAYLAELAVTKQSCKGDCVRYD